MNLTSMANEYRKNITIMEKRMISLESALKKSSPNQKHKLHKRIRTIRAMIYESVDVVIHLENYYKK